jgi:AraC family transcriptional regulator of arabinose operon
MSRLFSPERFFLIMDARVQRIAECLSARLSQPLELNEIARQVNLSASRLQHLFKSETGMTIPQYLKLLRMQQAKVLLENNFLTTKEIAAKLGINDLSHFIRDFKKIFGLPPASYKRRFQSS